MNKILLFIPILVAVTIIYFMEQDLLIKKEDLYPKNMNAIEKTEEPEQVIGSLMLGGLRVFVIDLLWMKMISQEEAGEYHELILTANMITAMQPTYTSVWEYLGFVLSNNVSAKEKDPQLKLEWVKSALDYLYKGLTRNPNSGMLYVAMGRTINERLGIYKERNLDNYFGSREEGKNPHELARFYLNEAVKTKNNQIYSERELFIANSYWVREAVFHLRNITEKQGLLALSILNNEPIDKIKKLKIDLEVYKEKYSKEGNLEEVSRRIKVALDTIKENISIYPGQTDFQPTFETHSRDYADRFNMAIFLDGCLQETANIIENYEKNKDAVNIDIAKLEIEIILLRIKVLGTEYIDDGGKTAHPYWVSIKQKQLMLMELQKKNESKQ